MDRFTYNYHTLNGEQSNRLSYVVDNGIDYSSYDDIKSGQTSGNYTYNKIGELVSDNSENMILHWRTGDHKLAKIERTDENSPELEFVYNPFGQRVMKIEKIRANGVLTGEVKNSYYAYDANSLSRCIHSSLTLFRRSNVTIGSQVMAIYELDQNSAYKLKERYLYGAERLGVNNTEVTIFENNTLTEFIHKETNVVHVDERGEKRYELTNQLGHVLATINDRKIYNSVDDNYEAVLMSWADYYCFGMLQSGRNGSATSELYRYGMQGSEMDNDVKGKGNSYTTYFRQLDPRLGRWMSPDPVVHFDQSPYCSMDNNPIWFNDPLGDDVKGYKSKRELKKYRQMLSNRLDNIDAQIALERARISEEIAQGRGMIDETRLEALGDLRNRVKKQRDVIDGMKTSGAVYRVRKNKQYTPKSKIQSQVLVNQKKSRRKTHIDLLLDSGDIFEQALSSMVAYVDLYESNQWGFDESFETDPTKSYDERPGQTTMKRAKYSSEKSTSLVDVEDYLHYDKMMNIWSLDETSTSLVNDIATTDKTFEQMATGTGVSPDRKGTTHYTNPNTVYHGSTGSIAHDKGKSTFNDHMKSPKNSNSRRIYFKGRDNKHYRPSPRFENQKE
jgi:RHS repeat-associated protein